MNQAQKDANRNVCRVLSQARRRNRRPGLRGLHEVVAKQFDLVKTSVKVPPIDDITQSGANPPTKEQLTAMPEQTYYAPKSQVGLDRDQPFDPTLADHDGNHALGRMISRVEIGRDKPEYAPQIVEHAVDLIAKGDRVQTACTIAGIPYETFVLWIERYPEFQRAVEVALSTAESELRSSMAEMAQKSTTVIRRTIITSEGAERIEETTTTKTSVAAMKYLLERRFACEDWSAHPSAPDKENDNQITVNYVHSYPEPKE